MKAELRRIEVLSNLSGDARERLASVMHRRRMAAGGIVFLQGATGDAAYFVLRGRVRIVKSAGDGSQQILHVCGPGDVFGAVVLFDAGEYPATAEALEDSELACLRRDDFQRLMPLMPEVARALVTELGARLRRAHCRLLTLSAHDAPSRLADLLLQLAGGRPATGNGRLRIRRAPTHQEMATYIGSARETVSRILARWRRKGWIAPDGSGLAVTHPDALHRLTRDLPGS